jgi:hypothetical protein
VSAQVLCGRCGDANPPNAYRCWVCHTPLAAPQKSAAAPLLKIVLISLAIIAMVPVLFFITCTGIVLFGSSKW